MRTDLAELVRDRVDEMTVPPADLALVERDGRRIRRRRRGAAAAGAALVVVATAALWTGTDDDRGSDRGIEPIGPMDFSKGLRAYADPSYEIHLGDRTFPADRLANLDTDAAATPYGVVFYDHGMPRLLAETGEVTALEPTAARGRFVPTAQADSTRPWVAYGATIDGAPTLVVHDVESGDAVGTLEVDDDTVIDAIDGGVVFLRTAGGTRAWWPDEDVTLDVAGPRTRVADVRNGVLLYDGPRPDGPAASDLRLVPGAIDAQLTYDGGHVLSWSSTLASTDGSAPIVLDQKATFYAVDTDGSILAAAPAKGGGSTVYDCAIPSGACEEIGSLTGRGGDPMFIGVDM